MLKILVLALVVGLVGCASKGEVMQRSVSPGQSYRLAGNDNAISIDGNIEIISSGAFGSNTNQLNVYFDKRKVILGNLSADYSGEVNGNWAGKNVSASCTSKLRHDKGYDVRCMVFIENERTVTLTF